MSRGLLKGYHHVIWDWNGTLVNYVEDSIAVINKLLHSRGINQIDGERYREIFGFPIRDYYDRLGFVYEKETFEDIADEFTKEYNQWVSMILHDGVERVLTAFGAAGMTQHILSAARETELLEAVRSLGLEGYFSSITGLTDNYAESKVEVGKAMMFRLKLNPDKTVLIGDTVHDCEVASELGCSCILVSWGHQSHARLKELNVPVVAALYDLIE